jgi:hypothetical protein
LRQTLEVLVSTGTRHTFSAPGPERGIVAARNHLLRELGEIARQSESRGGPPLQVELEPFKLSSPEAPQLGEIETANVLATLPGCEESSRAQKVYFVAHYDSRAGEEMDPVSDAPGANDNGAAVAMLVEVARVLAPRCLPSTVVFLFTTGEEQGLYGAQHHAQRAKQEAARIVAIINSDMVGDPVLPGGQRNAEEIRVFSEGFTSDPSSLRARREWGTEQDSPSRRLAWLVRDIAQQERLELRPQLIPRPDRIMRGGDHLAFNESGYAAVRLTQPSEHYERQHANVELREGVQYGDLLQHVDFEYLTRVTRLNVALAEHLASMPLEPQAVRLVMRRPGHEMLVRWQPSAHADRYEVWTRGVSEAEWRSVTPTNGTEARIPHSPDAQVAGIRACRARYCSPIITAAQRADE